MSLKKGDCKKKVVFRWLKKVLRFWVKPIMIWTKKQMIKIKANKARKHYLEVINGIKNSGRKKLNFAVYVIYDSTYGMDAVFRKMMNDQEHWKPMIVVIPDVFRGEQHARNTYTKTKKFFSEKYGEEYILDGWNPDTNQFYDHIDKFDIIYYANPYDDMAHEYHKIRYALDKKVLPVYISYGYDVGRYTTLSRLENAELNLVWKLFADTVYTYNDYLKYKIIKGKNVVLSGYSKMDNLAKYPMVKNKRKKVLIAPHHTVTMEVLPLSNFLNYFELILKLPEMFPELDFVFRPHPLLFTTLINEKIWTQVEVENYIARLQSMGVEYSTGGDYLKLFAECDAIVNDCGSFTVEWLYTGKPGCFVYNKKLNEDYLTTLMNESIKRYSIARSEEDIIDFIKRISTNKSESNYKMDKWVENNIALNYPRVSDFLLKELNIFS